MSTERTSILSGITCLSQSTEDRMFFRDPVCGNYSITYDAEFALQDEPKKKFKIACVLSERCTRGQKPVLIRSINGPVATTNNYQAMGIDELIALFPKSPLEMIEQSLINLSTRVEHPGDVITVMPDHCYSLYSPDSNGVEYILRQLEGLGYIVQEENTQDDGWSLTIETSGWAKLQELTSSAKSAIKQIFAAMHFAPEMDAFFKEGIFSAVQEFGMRCVRIDRVDHNNKICDEIIAEIRRSRAVIADFSGQRGGVYYEAGFAQGLGLPVIWTVKKDDLMNVHFDTRQYNHIVYETPAELKTALLNRLRATISSV